MTQKEIDDRIKAIEELQSAFDRRVERVESRLLNKLYSSFTDLRSNFMPSFKKVWNFFLEDDYLPLIDSFVNDMGKIVKLNETYFDGKVPTEGLYERLGITAEKAIVKDGYLSTVIQDQTAKREVQQFLNRTRQLKTDQKVKQDIEKLIVGEPAKKDASEKIITSEKPGIIKKFTNQNVTDSYNEADRIIQQDYARDNDLTAMMYTGGLIDSSRPFCVERNRKVFLISEIALFGTSEDKFGGYTDKEAGLFSGKPKTGYDPFTQCGGHNCRHHLSVLDEDFALLKDKALKVENGKLIRI